jgi:hypothetical protein
MKMFMPIRIRHCDNKCQEVQVDDSEGINAVVFCV